MELITFDHPAYQELVNKINRIADYVFHKEASPQQKQETWLTSEELADLLRISTRTLQRMRKDQTIPYTILRRKCLYRLSDVEKCIADRIITCSPQTLEDFYKNYRLTQTPSRHES
ncbi:MULTISPECIES: helix-turn-helix domain-containing protein [Bacteroidales]|uniref:helix-turn-helix domain-containing protein n=1 Tax=Bacteroidales TaxID=171549 RepID=UPI00256FDC1D|nr:MULTISPECIES: helix-turn-helix domain-containing protein [Bacteroidales]